MVESGTVLADRYRLDRRLGAGGMGEVWQARDLKFERDLGLRRDVAIKLMHSTLTESDMLKRFQLEAKILSKLNHPHIVRMLDADWHDGQLFIVMELLADQDLGQLLSVHPRGLPVRRAAELARQLAFGLSVVHQRGIVHRDLKPANLFVQPGDLLKIGDFGIARDSSASSVLTAHGVIMGTWAYIAPERWLGTWNGEPTTDLYSMGCILYELLTGETPFAADSMAIIRMHCEEIPAPPRSRNRDIPERLNRLVLRLLAKDPAARPASAAQVAAELTQIMPAWSDWQHLTGAGPGVTDVACSSRGPGHVEVFAVGAGGRISRRDYTEWGGWTDWQDLPAPARQRVAAITSTSHPFSPYQKLAVLTAGGEVYHAWRSAFGPGGESGWTPWRDLPALGAP